MKLNGFARKLARYAVRRVNDSPYPWVRTSYVFGRTVVRRAVGTLTPLQPGWVAHLMSVTWSGPAQLRISGYAFERGLPYPGGPPEYRLWLQAPGHSERIVARTRNVVALAANQRLKNAGADYSNTGFEAEFDLSGLVSVEGDDRPDTRWQLMVEVVGEGRVRRGTARTRFGGGSAGLLSTSTVGDRRLVPVWQRQRGLTIVSRTLAATVSDAVVHGRQLTVELTTSIPVSNAVLVSSANRTPLAFTPGDVPGTLRLTGVLSPRSAGIHQPTVPELGDQPPFDVLAPTIPQGLEGIVPQTWHQLVVTDRDGREHLVAAGDDIDHHPPPADATLHPLMGPQGRFVLWDTAKAMVVDEYEFQADPEPRIRMAGRAYGDLTDTRLALIGPRQVLEAGQVSIEDGRFEAFVPLLVSTWGQPPLPPKPGAYTLRGRTSDDDWFPITTTQAVVGLFPDHRQTPEFMLRFQTSSGRGFQVRVWGPRRPDELGSYHQKRLEADYRATIFRAEKAVYFESFYGRASTCNPRALDAVIAQRYPDWTRYWGVVDRSVGVPPGAVAVVEGTREWWDARGRARYVVVNDWIRRRFKHQPHQVVLQTWHGSMLKRIGLDRPTTDAMARRALLREQSNWDLLLSQNRHSTDIFRSAYDWTKPILEEGYPRNDAMLSGSGARIREKLGIASDKTVVLYAPTWRDNQAGIVTFLDLARLSEDLGPEHVVLLRGHSRTMGANSNVILVPGVIDVTTYPDITELFLAADQLITDYSSVMFDFSVTGKPMIFFVPDMDDYRDSVRGVYFDLSDVAPGPILSTQEEVTRAILSADADVPAYASRYAQWRERFNLLDDGHSAERVVDRLFATQPSRPTKGWATPSP